MDAVRISEVRWDVVRFMRVRVAQRTTNLFIDTASASSASTRLRRRRWSRLVSRFPDLAEMRVLDLGGTVRSWRLCPVRPAHLTLLNMFDQSSGDATVIVGDACEPPAALERERFDLVYSNSVIEHVGDHDRRRRFAETVRTLGTHHWVQTPNRYFPVEPHFLCPGLQFLPQGIAASYALRWPLGHYAGKLSSVDEAKREVAAIHLLSGREVRVYFPSSDLLHEYVGPLIKSLIAAR
jgi:hypothetical protein